MLVPGLQPRKWGPTSGGGPSWQRPLRDAFCPAAARPGAGPGARTALAASTVGDDDGPGSLGAWPLARAPRSEAVPAAAAPRPQTRWPASRWATSAGSGGERRRRRWPPRPGCGSWRFGACCPPPRGEETDARGFARPRLARGARPHLAAWGRANHGLVRRRELGRVEQARAVDGHVTQRAERGGTEVQVQAPEKAEAGCGQSGAGARAGGILSKQTTRLVGVPSSNVRRVRERNA